MISWEEEPYLSSHSERDEKKGGRKEKKIQEKEKEKRKGIENVSTSLGRMLLFVCGHPGLRKCLFLKVMKI